MGTAQMNVRSFIKSLECYPGTDHRSGHGARAKSHDVIVSLSIPMISGVPACPFITPCQPKVLTKPKLVLRSGTQHETILRSQSKEVLSLLRWNTHKLT